MAANARPLLILVHYFAGSSRSWSPLVAEAGRDFDIQTPDLIGFGASITTSQPTLDTYVDQILRLAADRPFGLVGHSMGGKIALAAAARRPAHLKGLLLVCASPPTPEPMQEDARRESIDSFGDPDAARKRVAEAFGVSVPADIFEPCVADQLRVSKAAWMWWLERGSRKDISADMDAIQTPTLVVGGRADTVMGPQTPLRIAELLSHSLVTIVPGGHFLPLEQPAALAAIMRTFFEPLFA